MDVPALKRQRAANKGRLTGIINYIKAADDDTPIEEFRTRLARVEQLMIEFTNIESQILSLDDKEGPDLVYEDNYYSAVTGLNTLIRSRSIAAGHTSQDVSFNATNNGHSHEVKLPRINIPPFSGDYKEWQSFYDLFTSTIHNSASLSPVQKFQYLKGLLRGEAAILLRHTSLTEANYIGALNKLKSRYDRKRHIINVFLRTFIDQPSITTANPDNIKRLMDTSDEVIRGLKALGYKAESRDHWLIYLLVIKLDEKSKSLWAQHVADLENPEFTDFMEFLSKRIDTLETVNMSLKKPTTQARVKSHVTVENKAYNCAKCNASDHSLVACQQLNQMDAEQRRNWAKEENRCFNCLSRRHRAEKCLSKYRCQHCKKKHHTLLHAPDDTKPGVNSNEAAVPIESTTSYCSQTNVKHTILPTALINILDSTGRIAVCRALLDSGSQASFISASCVQRLGLQRTNARLSITGLGSSSAGYTRGKATFIVRPKCHPEVPMEALILSKITSNLPHQSIEGISFSSWPEIQLADPQFHKSSRIDVLIGADYFFNLLEPAKIVINQDGLIAQKTVFGWVVSGSFENKSQDKLVSMFAVQSNVDLDQTLRRFWELESITTSKPPASSEESFCENHFNANVKLANDGRFIVNLPFKKSPDNLGKSLHTAIQRLRAMERRFTREPEFHSLYREFMHEYQGLHHLKEIRQPETIDVGHYLPHHGVLKLSSTTSKLRAVFDGSANAITGISLNNCLAIGQNAADCASRGLFPKELADHRLWWRGPSSLHKYNDRWPPQQNNYGFNEEENHKAFTFTNTIDDGRTQWFDQLMSKYSTITKINAVLAYVLRFITIMKTNTPIMDCLTREELFSALFKLCEHEKMRFYSEEMRQLRASQEISKSSSIKSLNPFMDKVGLIRVGGRLENTNVSFSTKHPIILHPKSQLSRLLSHSIHMDNKHAGPLLTLAISRQDYWIPGCRNVVRQVISRCIVCTKFKAQTASQLMGNLPSCRVELIRPFLRVGIDYAGPILIHMRKGRGQRSYKSYICLFVCLSTKAIHLELVSDAFVGALKRFVSRRGVCQEVFSDNDTNFIGADRKLREEFNKIVKNSKLISDYLSRQFITWHFIPPSAPHFGGIWEAGVKATKYHLRRVIGNTILTQEEMITLLAEIESILNSRPLCSINATDIDVLTPSHFLIGLAATKIPEADITHFKPSHLSRWQMVQQLTQHFWRRWYIEYLTSLQPRSKWREKQSQVNVNDIVIIKDNNTSVNQWPLGRVTKIHPGTDGLIRVVTLKTKSGEITRPIHKLCILPTSNKDESNTHLLSPSSPISAPNHPSTSKG